MVEMSSKSPYSDLEPHAFWRTAVAEAGIFGMSGLWKSGWTLPGDAAFATYGSCFAQHISRALIARDLNWLNCEPGPDGMAPETARNFNYGVFSARTGNIYTARLFLHWVRLAAGYEAAKDQEIWHEAGDGGPGRFHEAGDSGPGRFRPALFPTIEPDGFEDADEARAAIAGAARAFQRSVRDADVFIFTLGLTEGWLNRETMAPYALCPGTIAGEFDADLHVFENAEYPAIRADLEAALSIMRDLNPQLRILFTVSPVPLTATASGHHVLPATTYSKSALRAVAGDLAAAMDHVDYFPSYEIIAGTPARGAFFAPNLRSVEMPGVSLVMSHFFAGLDLRSPAGKRKRDRPADTGDIEASLAQEDLICEEESLEASNET